MSPKKHLSLLAFVLLAAVFIPQAFSDEAYEDDSYDEPEVIEIESNEVHSGSDEPEIMKIEMEDFTEHEGRSLASLPNIRIGVDYTYVTSGTASFKSYVKTQLIPVIVSYFEKALTVKHPLKSKIKSTASSLCGFKTPTSLKNGVSADIVFIINTVSSSSSWAGIATSCALGTSGGVTKPLIVNIGINTRIMNAGSAVSDPLTHDLNINTLMHEFLHGFAVRGSLYNYFLDSRGNKLKNHVKKIKIAGVTRQVLDLPALTERLRSHYKCNTLPGIIMENDGGAHFERRYFAYDLMSTGGIIDGKMTEFDLGFLEGTGWYVPNYSYAEPYFFGKGEGCGFVYNSCDAKNFDSFCSGTAKDCGVQGNSGGKCVSDSKSERCKYVLTQRAFNCENPSGTAYTTFASSQVYGRGKGSKCFSGTLSTSKSAASQNTYCFTYSCLNSGKTLRVNFGKQTFDCKKEGPLKIFSYGGSINCPDPETFCSTIGKPTCPKNCMGRGTCVSGKCKCNSGFQGTNCAFTR